MGHPDDASRFSLGESAGPASIVSEALSRTRDRDSDQMPTDDEIEAFGRSYPRMTPIEQRTQAAWIDRHGPQMAEAAALRTVAALDLRRSNPAPAREARS